jgi:hypothetical protein
MTKKTHSTERCLMHVDTDKQEKEDMDTSTNRRRGEGRRRKEHEAGDGRPEKFMGAKAHQHHLLLQGEERRVYVVNSPSFS